jgi:prephenate dehydratase
MHDQKDNFTRFIALSNKKESILGGSNNYITSIMFEVKNVPSALYKAIGGFAKNDVNILKIESYIPLGRLEESHFHIDVDGSIESKDLKLALKELELYTIKLKILGSYKRNLIK